MKGTRFGAGFDLRDPTGDFRIPFSFMMGDIFRGEAIQD